MLFKVRSMNVEISFGERLSDLRLDAGFSQEELAEKLGTTRNKIMDWERNKSMPKAMDIIGLSRVLNTSCDMILRGVQPKFLSIHEATGLNNKAIYNLKKLKESSNARDRIAMIIINELLENQEQLTETITRYLERYLGYEYVMRTVRFFKKVEGKPFNDIYKDVIEEEKKDFIHKAVLEDCIENPRKNSNFINQRLSSTLSTIYEFIRRGNPASRIETEIQYDFIKCELALTRALKKIVHGIADKVFKSKSQIKLLSIKGDWISEGWQDTMYEESVKNEKER